LQSISTARLALPNHLVVQFDTVKVTDDGLHLTGSTTITSVQEREAY